MAPGRHGAGLHPFTSLRFASLCLVWFAVVAHGHFYTGGTPVIAACNYEHAAGFVAEPDSVRVFGLTGAWVTEAAVFTPDTTVYSAGLLK